jgi:hypothetical protein
MLMLDPRAEYVEGWMSEQGISALDTHNSRLIKSTEKSH